jgi:hypothetical protein
MRSSLSSPAPVIAIGLCLGLVACSSADDAVDGRPSTTATTTTTTASSSASSPVPTDTKTPRPDDDDEQDATTSTTADRVVVPAMEVAIYWVRPYGGPDAIDIPAYADAAGVERPYVLYGSVTNTGNDVVVAPGVVATWRDVSGGVIGSSAGRVLGPFGASLDELAPGATADVIVVVDDPELGPMLESIQPELIGVSGGGPVA